MSRILVGVSGGPDSVACLLLLLRLRQQFGFEVVAAHFDHQLRPESPAEGAWVRDLCATLEVRCLTGEGEAARVAAERRTGIEDAARRMRYQFLAFVAGKELADCIATGHTADDQAETVLHRVLRGSGVRGIRGMLPASQVPGAPAQRLIRPLLVVHRRDTLAVCAEAAITPMHDPTNADPLYLRNRLRLETLPALRRLNPAIDAALGGLAESAREAFALVEKLALAARPEERGEYGSVFPRTALSQLPGEALTLVIEREAAFANLEPETNRTRIQNLRAVLARGTGRVRFGGVEVEASCGLVRIGPPAVAATPFGPAVLNIPGVTVAGPYRVTVGTDPLAGGTGESLAIVPTSGLRGVLRVRPIVAGDRIRTRGLTRKLSDYLTNEKVPTWRRHSLVAITDADTIVALLGLPGAATGVPPTEPCLHLKLARLEPARR